MKSGTEGPGKNGGMSMKNAFGGMVIAASTHLLYCVVMAVFAQYRAAMRHARCLRWIFRFDHATICLAFAFLFFGAVGSMAQQRPAMVLDELQGFFHSKEPFSVSIEFSEPVTKFDAEDITVVHVRKEGDAGDVPAGCEPTISTFQQSTTPENREIHTFTVTPKGPLDIVFTVGTNFEDLQGNPPIAGSGGERTTKYNGPVIYARPVANAGPDQLMVTPERWLPLRAEAQRKTASEALRPMPGPGRAGPRI